MTTKVLKSTALVGAALLSVSSLTQAQTLRLNHNNPEDHPTHVSMEFMGQRLSELTDGEMNIRVYANAQLGTQRESMELVQNCTLDMARSNTSELEAFEPIYSAVNLPFIFESEEHFEQVINSEVGQDILNASQDKGFIGIAFLTEGARSFYGDRAINTPADLEGLNVRVQPSPSAIRMVELLGGNATPIDWGELYSALQQGVVEMTENNPTALTNARHGEIVSNFSLSEHTIIPSVVVISTCAWNSMSEEQQAAMRQAASEAQAFHSESWSAISNEALEVGQAEMGVEINEVDKAPFIEAVMPMHEEVAAESAELAELIERIKAEAN
ncbi:TRAP transporter substrate-binding protein [Halomonas sp. MCCC 1A11036]|uniref:TRAP transporter substrate-binding protein n=1 Tax=Billgrantia zhangzhouensis TaxID=2733481 RepID=A0ABS9AC55_9GAMM|nr:TRAP transporter substrate-binding protein [Halomonas zhangzhouensis]MCE8019485.1 TRAP transporter substrate-binding protein [Halomonas zhangzhouensis]